MSSPLEGIKGLMRGTKGLPDDLSATEVNHYAMEVVKRVKRGDTVQSLEQYLRRINAPGGSQIRASATTRELAERAFALANPSG